MRHDFKLTGNQPVHPLAAGAMDVCRDMERIFGAAAHRAAEATPDPVVPIATAEQAKRRSWLPVVVMAALAGLLVAGGAIWMGLQGGGATPAASRAAASVLAPPVKGAAPIEVAAAPAPAVRPPVASAPEAPAAAHAAAPKAAAITPRHKPKAQRVRASDGNILDDRFNSRIRASPMYPDIAAADREMREAYARAAYVGLDPKLLRAYRERWRQARQAVEPDPGYAIEAYYQLARELDAARRRS